MIRDLLNALQPLVAIADAYDANELDEALPTWGSATPDNIELYAGRGGKKLLTLADCLAARQVVRKSRTVEKHPPTQRNPWRLEIHEKVEQRYHGELATTTSPCSSFKVVAIKGDKKVVLFQNSQFDPFWCIIRGTREKSLEDAQAKAIELHDAFGVHMNLSPKREQSEIEKLEAQKLEIETKLAALRGQGK